MKGIILGSKRLDMLKSYFDTIQINYECIDLAPDSIQSETDATNIKYLKEQEYVDELNTIMKTKNIGFILSNAATDHQTVLDSQIAENAKLYNIPFLGHSKISTLIFSNKHKTKTLFEQNDIKTPQYYYCTCEKQLLESSKEIGFPVVIKSIYGSSGNNQCIAQSITDIENFVKHDNSEEYIVEEFIKGIEVSIEVFKSGSLLICLPPIYKSNTSLEGIHALEKIRIFPYFSDQTILKKAKLLGEKIANLTPINGWLDIEAILIDDEFHVIEVNPRFSGVSRLIGMAMKTNPYELMLRVCLDEELDFTDIITGVSMEIPITNSFPMIEDDNIYCSIRPHAKKSKGFITVSSKNFDLLRDRLMLIGQNANLSKDIEKAIKSLETLSLSNEKVYEFNEE